YRFNQNVLVVLTGSRFRATLDGAEFPYFKAVHVKKGQELDIGPSQDGARCFLTVKGGFHVPQVLGSRSTHLMTLLGGYEGRALKKGDQINFGYSSTSREPEKLEKIIEPDRSVLRVTKGLQYDRFESKIRDVFFRERFIVSQRSNRMGLRTEGPEIKAGITDEILTEGLPIGAVQVPGNGHPIISFVDHQTTGGYPKIANVIAADLCKVGQLKPGDEFKFQLVSVVEAEKLYFEQESFFQKFTHSNS
ncbi:MAG: biotin-dependent carboxyltransferase family protein, partial [Candidatus Marinimicrobia bacterium]|nr:biotin-dependent carboxyltransferase family protein [Candidatus Neomarinimicrobiota bacterium]